MFLWLVASFFVMRILSHITFKAVHNSRGIAAKVAFLTVAFAVMIIILAISIASGFRKELTSYIVESEGDYWLECRDSIPTSRKSSVIDSQLIKKLYTCGVERVEARISSDVVILSSSGPVPIEVRSSSQFSGDGVSLSKKLASKLKIDSVGKIDLLYSMNMPFVFPVSVDTVFNCTISELATSIAFSSPKNVAQFRGLDREDMTDGYVVWGGTLDEISKVADGYNIWIYDVRERFTGIFDWLDVIDGNVWLVVIIMIIVGSINMLASALTMVLENTHQLAVLKSLGMPISAIRSGLMFKTLRISVPASLTGLAFALVVCFLESKFAILSLPSDDYLVSAVPVNVSIWYDLLATFSAVVIITLTTILSTLLADRVKEDVVLRYE